jgi:hypothetical protein
MLPLAPSNGVDQVVQFTRPPSDAAVNIFLIPYTWLRHISMALWCASFGLLGWWTVLTVFVGLGPAWHPVLDGSILITTLTGTIAFASLLGENTLRRRALLSSAWRILLGVGIAVGLGMVGYWLWDGIAVRLFFSGKLAPDATDTSLVSLRYRIGIFLAAGLASGAGPLVVRKGKGWFNHLAGGLASGLAGGIAWHIFNFDYLGSDLYLAGAAMGITWGFMYGLLVWAIPDELYAGWIRVLSSNRFARRIPIDALDGGPTERFVGHFPRGLDLFLPVQDQVMELHISVAVDERRRYKARGLSVMPTRVMRFLERLDLHYNRARPAPLETRLASGDRIRLGEGPDAAELEFIMLPKEER